MESFEVCYCGGAMIEKRLNELLIKDNPELVEKYAQLKLT